MRDLRLRVARPIIDRMHRAAIACKSIFFVSTVNAAEIGHNFRRAASARQLCEALRIAEHDRALRALAGFCLYLAPVTARDDHRTVVLTATNREYERGIFPGLWVHGGAGHWGRRLLWEIHRLRVICNSHKVEQGWRICHT